MVMTCYNARIRYRTRSTGGGDQAQLPESSSRGVTQDTLHSPASSCDNTCGIYGMITHGIISEIQRQACFFLLGAGHLCLAPESQSPRRKQAVSISHTVYTQSRHSEPLLSGREGALLKCRFPDASQGPAFLGRAASGLPC